MKSLLQYITERVSGVSDAVIDDKLSKAGLPFSSKDFDNIFGDSWYVEGSVYDFALNLEVSSLKAGSPLNKAITVPQVIEVAKQFFNQHPKATVGFDTDYMTSRVTIAMSDTKDTLVLQMYVNSSDNWKEFNESDFGEQKIFGTRKPINGKTFTIIPQRRRAEILDKYLYPLLEKADYISEFIMKLF